MINLDKINISRLQPILAQIPQLSRYRLLVIFPILLLVWMAQNAFDNLSDMGFFWLFVAGLLLFVVLPRPLFPPMEVEMPALRLAGKRRFWAGVAVSFISLPIMLHSVTEFFAVNVPEEISDREPWQAFMYSVVFLIAGGLMMTRSNGQQGWWRSLTWGFFVILGLGTWKRM